MNNRPLCRSVFALSRETGGGGGAGQGVTAQLRDPGWAGDAPSSSSSQGREL